MSSLINDPMIEESLTWAICGLGVVMALCSERLNSFRPVSCTYENSRD